MNSEKHPDVSIIIVNYNVAYFLEQCLNSVFAALKNCSGEVFVVDNNSIDNSVELVREKFPQVHLMANKENLGFSKANNQAMRKAKGRYVLLLNPDTVVEEDTFSQCIDFMDSHPEAGGLGVRMIDGKGNFLPESKRGLPTPSVAFYKIFGISRLFPKSKRFGKYHLGYLNEFETNEVEVLSGAFMWMRKSALDKVGLLDEAFFMYGEDIDLSYRIQLGGYKNFYFPKTQIIHYKGESTKKSSINYVFVFYRAMVIFAKKHFSQKNAELFSFLINLAIYFRAGIAIANRFVRKAVLPLFDFTVIVGTLLLYTGIWEKEHISFPQEILFYAIPAYVIIWMINVLYSGGYDKPVKMIHFFKGTIIGTLIILAIYALLPKDVQFSRLFILLGAVTVFLYYVISRFVFSFIWKDKFDLKGVRNKVYGIIGSVDEVNRVVEILKTSANNIQKIHRISPTEEKQDGDTGTISQLDQIVHIHHIDEVIFCAKDNSAERIIKWMSKIASDELEFKIAQPNSLYLIGSNSVDTSGDVYMLEIDKITEAKQKRNKRSLDVLLSILMLLFSPIILWLYKNKRTFLLNCWLILIGKKSFVGYAVFHDDNGKKLPAIKKGILSPILKEDSAVADHVYKQNILYARNYSVLKDVKVISEKWKELDQ